MKPSPLLWVALVAACDSTDGTPDPAGPDAGMVEADAAIDSPPPEPSPAFTAGSSLGGQLAITEAGIRPTFSIDGTTYVSVVTVGLTETATQVSCGVTLVPGFVQFSGASTSTRQFKTVVLDFATATIFEDTCHWDDAHILAGLEAQFGSYVVGFAQARFAEDRPYIDVYLNAANGLGNQTANIVRAGGGVAWAMDANGVVTESMVEPTPGAALVRAVYDF